MKNDIDHLTASLTPENTILFFGAGSSIPSGLPSTQDLCSALAKEYNFDPHSFSLAELASLIEGPYGRKSLITSLRKIIVDREPTGGIVNLPHYDWKSLYTTNYDKLIERAYERHGTPLTVYASDFDFSEHQSSTTTKLFKLHGTIDQDACDGYRHRLIVTEHDEDSAENFRQGVYDRLRGDIPGSTLVIIGHSLSDSDIKSIADRAIQIRSHAPSACAVYLLVYSDDPHRIQLYENRGLNVVVGSLDQFFSSLASNQSASRDNTQDATNILDAFPPLRPVTIDCAHETTGTPHVDRIFNGRPASYAEIRAGYTFKREVSDRIAESLTATATQCVILLGAMGVGKTTASRQALNRLLQEGALCWEHQPDNPLDVKQWKLLALALHARNDTGILLIDDAHSHLNEINQLLDNLISSGCHSLKLLCISSRNHWNPRIKTPNIFHHGKNFQLRKLSTREIDRLLDLVDHTPEIDKLVENSFSGFSRIERRRRLVERCEADMFVCLKNIFASEKFDDIILREYAQLHTQHQEIYRHVAVMQNAGVRVHRQLIIRILGISPEQISAELSYLSDIITEYTINSKEGVYGWRGRHEVIVGIIAKYKFQQIDALIRLFDTIIDNISPTYEVELRTIREMCNVDAGLPAISDKTEQNRLLRKMMSIVPGERVPRHRLIRNLIHLGEFEKAETEIRIFEKDFKQDGPVARYQITLLVERARHTPGILEEDRMAILEQAHARASEAATRFPKNKTVLGAYCDVGLEIFRRTKDMTVYDKAMDALRRAEDAVGDPDITKMIRKFQSKISA